MAHLIADFRFALRSFMKAPVFTLVAIASLAIGIGANTAIFTLMDQVLLRALPIRDPEQLAQVFARGAHYGSNWGSNSMSHPMYLDLRDQNKVFDGLICRFATASTLSHEGQTERIGAELVSGNYFDVLGVSAAVGRLLTPADDVAAGAGAVAVLSFDYWQIRFGGKPGIVGQTIRVNNYPMTVVGVTQEDFHGVDLGYNPQVMVPVTMKRQMTPGWDALIDRRIRWVQVFGRLRPGVTTAQAKSSLQPIYKSIISNEVQQDAFRNASRYARDRFLDSSIDVLPGGQGRPQFRERFSKPLLVLMSIVGFVLLIACANVANLLLARATARQREIAVRIAIGASRTRIITQLLCESVLLSLLGGFLGMLLAIWLDRYLLSVMPQGAAPLPIAATPDLRIFGFTLAVSLLTGVIFGLVPALQSTRTDIANTLKDQAGSVTSKGSLRFRKGLVIAQVTLSLLLLIGAGLFIGSFRNLKSLNLGFRTTNLIAFAMNPSLGGYDRSRTREFFKNAQATLAGLPGAQSVAMARLRVLDGERSSSTITVEGYTSRDGEDMEPWVNVISPGYFATLGIPMVAGREFRAADERSLIPQSEIDKLDLTRPADRERHDELEKQVTGAPKYAIVNERFARQYFPGGNATGRRFGFGGNPGTKTDVEIVGVVKDSNYGTLREEIPRQVFVPYLQGAITTGMHVYVRTSQDPARMFASIRRTIQGIDGSLPIYDLRTMDEQINRSLITERMIAMLSAVFGIIATLLAMVGLYGVMAYTVARRTREIGIRMALGAFPKDVIWMVMREVLVLVGLGAGVGLILALLLTRYIQTQLFGLTPNDPLTVALATATLLSTAGLAGYIPAMRASRVSPVRALHYE